MDASKLSSLLASPLILFSLTLIVCPCHLSDVRPYAFVRLRYSFFKAFLSCPLVWWCPLPIFPSACRFRFLQAFWYGWFGCSIPFVIRLFPFFIMSMVYFSRPNPIHISWLYILIIGNKISNFFYLFFANSLIFAKKAWLGGWFFLRVRKFVAIWAFSKYYMIDRFVSVTT